MTVSGDLNRRRALKGLAASTLLAIPMAGLARQVAKKIEDLKPEEFTWHPERSAQGPVAIVVSIPDQKVHVYRNGIRIAVSTCSTGKSGHETPTGVFTILEKDKHHRSSTYNNAPMPNMNRLTWGGVALHAGQLPGYPASHGCVRLPLQFSEKLFTVTHVGTPVIIAGGHSYPQEVSHPGLLLAETSRHWTDDAVRKVRAKNLPQEGEAAISIVASSADGKIDVLENGKIVAEGPLSSAGGAARQFGEHVYVLSHNQAQHGLVWHAIGHHPGNLDEVDLPDEATLRSLTADQALVEAIHARLHPGAMLVLTDLPLHPDMRSGTDFVVMTA